MPRPPLALLAGLALGSLGGAVFYLLSLPLPWMLGRSSPP